MPTAAQATGDISILDTVLSQVSDEAIYAAFGFGRDRLAQIVAGSDIALKRAMVERAWEALMLDATQVSMPGALLAKYGRAAVAASLAATVANSQFYSGPVSSTALHHRLIANTMVTRATFFQFEKDTVSGVDRLLRGALDELLAESESAVSKILQRLQVAKTEAEEAALRRDLARQVRQGRGSVASHVRAMEEAIREYEQKYIDYLLARGGSLGKIAHQRAVDTLYHFEHTANYWSRLRHPLSAAELGAELYSGRVQDLAVARIRTLVEARGLPFNVRREISDIIAKEVIIKGEPPREAAKRILKKYRAELGERWGGAKVSAERIARTEAAAIQAEGTLLAYEQMGVEWVNVHWTEGNYPCNICPPIADGGPYPIRDIPGGGIPFHPNCRCAYSAAEPPKGKGGFNTLHPSEVFGAGKWAKILAKYGFVAATAKAAFGNRKPTDAEQKQVKEAIGELDMEAVLRAPGILRPGYDRQHLRGFRRIEAGTFPTPVKGEFVEIRHRDPVRAVLDLRKNTHEVGGVIRGKSLYYYRGEGGSVSIAPIYAAVGGFVPGDILFHTHPGSLPGGLSTSIPSEADIRVHLMLSTYLGDGARHIIAGSDGLRELKVVITNEEEWRQNVQSMLFSMTMLFFEEAARGLEWYATYGIRRAARRLKDANLGGYLVISEPTTPGSEFIPLADWNPRAGVPAVVVKSLEAMETNRLRELYDSISAEQGAPSHRDRDYYVGVLRSIDPTRDWDEAAPTKSLAISILSDLGAGIAGTRWSRKELLAHLTGQPIHGRVYLDAARIDYQKVLELDGSVAQAVDKDFIGDLMGMIDTKLLDLIFDRVSLVHGIPYRADPSVLVAALESLDGKDRDWHSYTDMIPLLMEHEKRGMLHQSEERDEDGDRIYVLEWSEEQKRDILSGKPVYGITFLPDLSLVRWGQYFNGMPEDPPDFVPLPTPERTKGPVTLQVTQGTRHTYFRERFGIDMRDTRDTKPWTVEELRMVEHLLVTFPEAAEQIKSISRYSNKPTAYDPILRRLVVGTAKNATSLTSLTTQAIIDAMMVHHLNLGHMVPDGGVADFTGPVGRMPLMRSWLGVDGGGRKWRVRGKDKLVHRPTTHEGTEAVLNGGEWIDLAKRKDYPSPWWTLIHSILDFIWQPDRLDRNTSDWIRDNIFAGDHFVVEPTQLAIGSRPMPIRL